LIHLPPGVGPAKQATTQSTGDAIHSAGAHTAIHPAPIPPFIPQVMPPLIPPPVAYDFFDIGTRMLPLRLDAGPDASRPRRLSVRIGVTAKSNPTNHAHASSGSQAMGLI
jgi:hypothetical protein